MVRGFCTIFPSVDNHHLSRCHGSINTKSWHILAMAIILCTTALNLELASSATTSTVITSKRPSFDLPGAPAAEKLQRQAAEPTSGRYLLQERKTAGSDGEAMRALVGSSPPKCIKKCRGCTPCKGVLVPIHTNSPETPTEYYPEAWRCQCKGKFYNP